MIYEKEINEITKEDIEILINEKIMENKYLEFKSSIENKNREKEKINKTLCGFANAEGGLFIYGLEEENGYASKLSGINIKSWDDEKLRLQSIIDNIKPRIEVKINKIDLDNEKILILFKVLKSFDSPHGIKNGNCWEFPYRRDGETIPLEINEIEKMFTSKNTLQEKIEEFKDERIFSISSDYKDKGFKIIFHAIPLESFSDTDFDLNSVKNDLLNLESFGGIYVPNFEGLNIKGSYFNEQLYRNGIYEKICIMDKEEKNVQLNTFENIAKQFIKDIFIIYEKLGITSSVLFFITYTNIKNCFYMTQLRTKRNVQDKDRDILPSNKLVLRYFDEELVEKEVEKLFKPFWNHFGYNR